MMDRVSDNDEVNQFWHRLEKQAIVMLTDTFAGGLRCRPMAARIRPQEGAIWFLTDRDSAKVDEVTAEPDVCIAVVDTGANLYMSLTGTCSLIEDRAKIAELWSAADKIFFDSPEDTRIVAMRVTPTQGQTWAGPSGPVAAVKMALSLLTGDKPSLGETQKVQL